MGTLITEITDSQRLYFEISAKGLIGKVVTEIKKVRPAVSRTSIRMAYEHGATTPFRRLVLDVSSNLLSADANESSAANT